MKITRKKSFHILQVFLFVACLIFFIKIYGHEVYQEFKSPRFLNLHFIIVTFCFWTLLYLMKSLLTRELYRAINYNIALSELFSLSIITSFLSYILPAGLSTAFKALYLKTRHNFRFMHFGGIEVFSFVVIYYGYLSFLLAGYISDVYFSNWTLYPISLVLLLIFPFCYKVFNLASKNKYPTFNAKIYIFAILNDIFYILLLYHVVEVYVDGSITFSSILIWAAIIQFSQFINFTPGNLGVRELVMAFTAPLVSMSDQKGALISVIIRLISILYTIIWLFYSYKVIFHNSKSGIFDYYKKFTNKV